MRRREQYYSASAEFISAVNEYLKVKYLPAWKLAAFVDIHPSVVSRLINGKELYQPELTKVKKLANIINFKGECFEALKESAV